VSTNPNLDKSAIKGSMLRSFHFGEGGLLGSPALRPSCGFLAQRAAPIDLLGCIRWWEGVCAAWWLKFTRRVAAEGGEELRGFVRYWSDWCCQTVRPLWSWLYSISTDSRSWASSIQGSAADYGKINASTTCPASPSAFLHGCQ